MNAFHVGAAVRRRGIVGAGTVDPALVRDWRVLVDASLPESTR